MNCEELLKALNEYVDGEVDPAICDEFAEHLADCNPCQVVVDNIRQTITLYQEGHEYPMPEAFKRRLQDALKERWRKKFGR